MFAFDFASSMSMNTLWPNINNSKMRSKGIRCAKASKENTLQKWFIIRNVSNYQFLHGQKKIAFWEASTSQRYKYLFSFIFATSNPTNTVWPLINKVKLHSEDVPRWVKKMPGKNDLKLHYGKQPLPTIWAFICFCLCSRIFCEYSMLIHKQFKFAFRMV